MCGLNVDLNILISGLITEDSWGTIPLAGVGVHTHRVRLGVLVVKLALQLLHLLFPDPDVLFPVLIEEVADGEGQHHLPNMRAGEILKKPRIVLTLSTSGQQIAKSTL